MIIFGFLCLVGLVFVLREQYKLRIQGLNEDISKRQLKLDESCHYRANVHGIRVGADGIVQAIPLGWVFVSDKYLLNADRCEVGKVVGTTLTLYPLFCVHTRVDNGTYMASILQTGRRGSLAFIEGPSEEVVREEATTWLNKIYPRWND